MNETDLLKRIETLEREVRSLRQSSTIPYDVQLSFEGRGFVVADKPDLPDPNGTYTTNEGFRRDIALTGNAETITVPAYPIRFLKIKGTTLYIPAHTYAEIP